MRLIANENVLGSLVRSLRELGHDVVSVAEASPGASDAEVLRLAVSQSRVVLTFDKDFGELAFHAALPSQCGVILLRIRRLDPRSDHDRALRGILQRADYQGLFVLIEDDRVRVRPLSP